MSFFSFYPTYEEWKHFTVYVNGFKYTNAFYPTYEEWKLQFVFCGMFQNLPFYPTYEEWKHLPPLKAVKINEDFLSYL